jgi:hypothetical protein
MYRDETNQQGGRKISKKKENRLWIQRSKERSRDGEGRRAQTMETEAKTGPPLLPSSSPPQQPSGATTTTATPPSSGRTPTETGKERSWDREKAEEHNQRKTFPQFTSRLRLHHRQPDFAATQGSLFFPFSFFECCCRCRSSLFPVQIFKYFTWSDPIFEKKNKRKFRQKNCIKTSVSNIEI